MSPRVSVVMPMYNTAAYVDAAISSIRKQTFRDFELLIIDDGSTDRSAAIAEGHARADGQIIVHRVDHKGISHAMNFGLARSRGEYIAIMHADDVAAQNRLERQLLFLESHPEIGVLGTAYRIVDENGKLIARIANPREPERCRAALSAGYNCICNHSAMVRKQAFGRAGPYVQELWPAEDYDMWLRMSEFTEIANLNECLETYRYHFENASYRRTLLQARTMVAALQAADSRKNGIAVTAYDVSWEGLRRKGVTEETLFAQTKLLYEAYLHWAIELERHDVAFRLADEFLTVTQQQSAEKVSLEFLTRLVGIYALKRNFAQIARLIRLAAKFGFSNRLVQLLGLTCSKLWEGCHAIDVVFSEDTVAEDGPPSGFIDSVDLATIDDLDNTSTVRVVGWSADLSPYRNQILVVGGARNVVAHRILRQDRPDVATDRASRPGFELVFDVRGKDIDLDGISVAVGRGLLKLRKLLRSPRVASSLPLSVALSPEPPSEEIAIAGYVDTLTLVPVDNGRANFALRVIGWAPLLQPSGTQIVTVHGMKKSTGRTQIERRDRPDAAILNTDWLRSGFELSIEVENPVDLSAIILTVTDASGVTNRLWQL